MADSRSLEAARARARLYRSLRDSFAARGYEEVETPLLVPAPGMEPHITAFEAAFVPETDVGRARTLYLHTSPEYAMKRLLADGAGPIFQLARVFRNGEVSASHNPEFTMLEFYRPNADYRGIMADTEALFAAADPAVGGDGFFARTPWERLTVRDAVLRETGIDLRLHPDGPSLRRAAEAAGIRVGEATSFDDVFFHVFLQRVELYARGRELANGFSELTDAAEQRRRLLEEQQWRREHGRPVYPLDEPFLAALPRMPPSGGIAVGMDRVLMLMLGKDSIEDVLLFPAHRFV